MGAEKESPADVRLYNETKKKETEHTILDKVYFWVVDRYTKHTHKFRFSDEFVWKGAVYVIPSIAGYMMFFALFLMLAHFSFKRYGEARTIVFFILLLIWRVQMGVSLLGRISKKL